MRADELLVGQSVRWADSPTETYRVLQPPRPTKGFPTKVSIAVAVEPLGSVPGHSVLECPADAEFIVGEWCQTWVPLEPVA